MKHFLTATALALLPMGAGAATYTYDFDFTFAMSGDDVGGFRNEGPGGALIGYFTVDEALTISDFGFDFSIIQRANRHQSARTDTVDLDFDDGDRFSSNQTVEGSVTRTTFGFSEITGLVSCSFRDAKGSPYSLSFQSTDFTAGAASATFRADSARNSPYCNPFGALMYDIRQPSTQKQISLAVNATLRSDISTDPVGTVPLPASGLVLVAGLGALGSMRRRKRG